MVLHGVRGSVARRASDSRASDYLEIATDLSERRSWLNGHDALLESLAGLEQHRFGKGCS